jgi:histidinol phosphatase-like enzyme
MIKCLIIDRDGVCVHHSDDPSSPFYYILRPDYLVLKPNLVEEFTLLSAIRRHSGLKVYLATRQRCISKGLISRGEVDDINRVLEQMVGFSFDGIYVEESASDKRALFARILADSGVPASEVLVLDDSASECSAARDIFADSPYGGLLAVRQTTDLYDAVTKAFNIS